MAVRFVLGRAGTGKTELCLRELAAALDEASVLGPPLWLLVPEQASFEMERSLAQRCRRGGFARARVLSFSSLAREVLAAAGIERQVVRPAARTLALQALIARQAMRVDAFGPAARRPGFARVLGRLIERLAADGVTPEALRALAAGRGRRLEARLFQLADAFEQYRTWLGTARIDPADRLAATREVLIEHGDLRGGRVWVDGFAHFSGQERATLVTLAEQATQLTITLLVDPHAPAIERGAAPDPLSLFHPTELTYQQLRRAFDGARLPPSEPVRLGADGPRFRGNLALADLEAALATPDGPSRPSQGGLLRRSVAIHECRTPRDELRTAARYIRRRMAEASGALRYGDFAVIARDVTPIADIASEVFSAYEIPFFLDRRVPLLTHPLAALTDALLGALESDFAPTAMRRLLQTELLPFRRSDRERLWHVVEALGLRSHQTWAKPTWSEWRKHANSRLWYSCGEDAWGALDDARRELVAAFASLQRCFENPNVVSGADWTSALLDAHEKLRTQAALQRWVADAEDPEAARRHEQAWSAFVELLEDLHATLGRTPLTFEQFATTLRSAMGDATIGIAPPRLDQVLIGGIERSRHPAVRHVWLCGMNEGVFPRPPGTDLLFNATERERLTAAGAPEALRSSQDDVFAERLLFYIACTRASDELHISYAAAGEELTPRPPSVLLTEVPGSLRAPLSTDAAPVPVCLDEFAREALQRAQPRGIRLELQAPDAALATRLSRTPLAERAAWLLRGLRYDNRVPPLPMPWAMDQHGVWSCSVSEVTDALVCPFRHFAARALDLPGERGPTSEFAEIGSLQHELLAGVWQRVIDSGADVREMTDDRWLTLLAEVAAERSAARPAELAAHQAVRCMQIELAARQLETVILAHAERYRRGHWTPFAAEYAFCDAHAFEHTLPDGERMWIRGRLDRVDVWRSASVQWYAIYDYKRAVDVVKSKPITDRHLQLWLYWLALERAGLIADSTARVGAALFAPLKPNSKDLDDPGEPEIIRLLESLKPRGVFDSATCEAFHPNQPRGDHSPYVQLNVRKKDGNRTGDLADEELLVQTREKTLRMLDFVGGRVARGEIQPEPLRKGKRLACNTCHYASVCRFESAFNTVCDADDLPPDRDDMPADVPDAAASKEVGQ